MNDRAKLVQRLQRLVPLQPILERHHEKQRRTHQHDDVECAVDALQRAEEFVIGLDIRKDAQTELDEQKSPEREKRADEAAKAPIRSRDFFRPLLGLPRNGDEFRADLSEPRPGKALDDAPLEAFERLHNLVGLELVVHDALMAPPAKRVNRRPKGSGGKARQSEEMLRRPKPAKT